MSNGRQQHRQVTLQSLKKYTYIPKGLLVCKSTIWQPWDLGSMEIIVHMYTT
jgi:hypothetical protein